MVMREKDDDLALFCELRSRENEKNDLNLLQNSEELEAPHGSNPGSAPLFNLSSSGLMQKKRIDDFLNSENEKSDYDWLLTPPGTPLFPSLEKESRRTVKSHAVIPGNYPTALNSRLASSKVGPLPMCNMVSQNSAVPPTLNASDALSARPASSGAQKTTALKPSIPTAQTTLPTRTKTTKPSRAPSPTSRPTLSSAKPTAPVRSSTPTRHTPRSSTPTTRPSLPASKPAPRSSTPTPRPSTSSAAPPRRSSSVSKSAPTAGKNPAPPRGTSPTVRSRPGFSNVAPPNLRRTLPDRPASASRSRPEPPAARHSTVRAASNDRQRQQSCSPSRGRKPVVAAKNGNSVPAISKVRNTSNDDVNPVLMGTKMVERVVNMRRLAPPKQNSLVSNNASGRSSSIENSGFGRTLSKKSLDMAIRHMDIKRSAPASSTHTARSGGSTKNRSFSASDSPLAASSNASSEPSVSNNSHCLYGSDLEDNGCNLEGRPIVSISHNGN